QLLVRHLTMKQITLQKTPVSHPPAPPVFWYSFSGHCCSYTAKFKTWADAELHCVSEGANLVSIHSLEGSLLNCYSN
uniref:C-type lectin domain-containing protein n=1 Tax=Oreochromis aureus TaxID=47969 RepID=A0AAZ1XN60_OREAU